MNGRGRVYDNIFVERLWWAVKYEDIYPHDYQDIPECKRRLEKYFGFYSAVTMLMRELVEAARLRIDEKGEKK